jgi:hypothetical protein
LTARTSTSACFEIALAATICVSFAQGPRPYDCERVCCNAFAQEMYGRDCGGESIPNDCQLLYVMHYVYWRLFLAFELIYRLFLRPID